MTEYEHLFEPIEFAGMKMRNRVLMPAMHLGMAEGGSLTDGFFDFYRERAKADPGPGLIVVGGCYTERKGMGTPSMVAIDDDRFIPRLREFTEMIHEYDIPVAAQLYHSGRYALSFIIGEQPVSASEVPSRFTRETPRALTVEEIAETQQNYARAARRARDAGFDASELISCSGYLPNQFLSPLTNKREDRYGGDIYGRMTFLLETIEAIKEATGKDFPLICRISGHDFMEGGHTLEETKIVAAGMVRAGVDMISVTGGWHETRVPQITMNVPRGAYVYLAEGIREAVERRVPVAACNRINNPDLAEAILAEDRADIVAMARAFLADPDILRKAREGRPEDIRTCVACNQGCFDHVLMLKPVSCTINPRVNRERETQLTPAAKRKKVLVAGGGPAGMEAAWVAAHRGHDVILCEETGSLGGQAVLAAVPPGREEWSEMVRYLERQVGRKGVDVRLGTPVNAELVKDVRPDAVVMATGARQLVPPIEGLDRPNVVYAWDVLSGVAQTGETVVVVGGGAVGIETASFLAERGMRVTVIEMTEKVGADVGISTRWTMLKDARELGVGFAEGCCVNLVTPQGLCAESGGGPREFEADTVIIAAGSCANDGLERELKEAGLLEGIEFCKIGDCKEPRKVTEAIREGFDTALKL